MPNQSNNNMKNCSKCRAENNFLAQRCRSCGSRFPTSGAAEMSQNGNAKISPDLKITEAPSRDSAESVDVEEYLAQLDREFSR